MDKSIQNEDVYISEWDHRKIGKELELFSFHEEGPGLPFFLPQGVVIKNQLIEYWRKLHVSNNYQEIQSPILLDKKLWEQSGHWELFKENMYISEVEKRVFAIKPMNCPGAILYYKEKKRSHSELPFRVCEMGQVHRDENSGSLHGLLRVRSFVVDDAHIFCSKDQLLDEIKSVLALSLKILKHCGFEEFDFELSVRSKDKVSKYLGVDKDWEFAESMLEEGIKSVGFPIKRMEGEAKFYGPAIDVKIKDSSGRMWQCSSVQMDFNLAGRFDVSYFDKDGNKQIPYILHRCIYGSLERFMGVLIEHYKGNLPMWLAPIQVRLISLSPEVLDYISEIKEIFESKNVRFDLDLKEDNLSEKIKRAQRSRVPNMILIGKKEADAKKLSLRKKNGKQLNMIDVDQFFKEFD